MKYPILLLAGRDVERREFLDGLDPEEEYKSKVLYPFLGKTVIEWVIDELLKSPYVEGLYILGLSKEDISVEGPIHFVPVDYQSKVSQKYKAGLDYLIDNDKYHEVVIGCSGDCPGVSVEGINTFFEYIQDKRDHDFILSVVPHEFVKKSFPDSKRAVAKLKDISLTQGEMAMFSPRAINEYQKVMDNFTTTDVRKSRTFMSLIKVVARKPSTWFRLFKIARGKGTLKDAIVCFSRAYNLKAAVAIVNDPGLSMDMDLPEDHKKLEEYVSKTKKI